MKAYIEPFEEMFGISVMVKRPVDYNRLIQMTQDGNISWHVVDMEGRRAYELGEAGYLETLDKMVVDDRGFFEALKTPWTGAGTTASRVMAFRSNAIYTDPPTPPITRPSSWADFWDLENFPRPSRSIHSYVDSILQIALLADDPELLQTSEGRAALGDSLTEEQIDRAFEKLFSLKEDAGSRNGLISYWLVGSVDEITVHVDQWFLSTAPSSTIYYIQQQENYDEDFVTICWECGHIVSSRLWAIPKGLKAKAPQKFELAQLFIAWASFPENNVRITRYAPYGPVNAEAIPLIDPDMVPFIPTSAPNIEYAITVDLKWLARNYNRLSERYGTFLRYQPN